MLEKLLQAIIDLTTALNANTAARGATPPTQAAAPAKEPKQTRAQKALEGAQTAQAIPAPQPAPAPAPAVSGLTVKDLVPVVTELMNLSQEGYNAAANIIQVAAGNVKGAKLPQVPPEKYADVKEQVEAALAKLKNPAPAASPPSLI